MNNFDDFINPDNDNKPHDDGVPFYVWGVIIVAFLWLIVWFFKGGVEDNKALEFNKMMKSHQESMRHPLRDSQPSDFLMAWD